MATAVIAGAGAGAGAGGGMGGGGVDAEGGLTELRERIRSAFDLFDKEGKGTIVEDEVPTVMRYLGVYASQHQIFEYIREQMQDEPAAFVTYDRFEAKVLELLEASAHAPDTEDTLLAAFRALDPDKTGYLEADKLAELLGGDTPDAFRDKELSAFFAVAKDAETGKIFYEDYIALLCAEDK